jgi:hypothetical protein
MLDFREQRILVLGKTYPSYSQTHDEVSCTGGLVDGTWEMVRLHPINFRDLPEDKQFKHWQWIRARVAKDERDPRPESLRIDADSIVLEEHVESHEKRRSYLEGCTSRFASVEALKDANESKGTSLGIVEPQELRGCEVKPRDERERTEWEATERQMTSQGRLFGPGVRKIDFPDQVFYVRWTCNDARCSGHEMSFHDWSLHELSRKLNRDSDRVNKVRAKMEQMLNQKKRDLYLMLGNFRGRTYQFGLMGVLSVPHTQARLF